MIAYGLIGAGGHGRETMPVLAEMILRTSPSAEHRLMFVVEGAGSSERVNGYPVVSLADFMAMGGERHFNVAIADPRTRERISDLCKAAGLEPLSIISSSTLVLDNNDIAEGAILSPFSVVTSNTRIGRFFHANIFSRVAHDCVIGDFVTFGPSVQCNGHVAVGDHAYVGAGAVLREGTSERPLVIGKGATVGMGSVVTKDVEPFTTVAGNPARPLVT